MNVFFTICSNNYLAQASVLGNSIITHHPEAHFFIFLCDEFNTAIDYNLPGIEIIPVALIEPGINELAIRYDIIELNTVVKPTIIQYLFTEKKAATAVFLDPDIKIYHSLSQLYEELNDASVILTPHILSPIPIDGKTPGENTFLNYGIYNLGFIGLRNNAETQRFLSWWKNHTYLQGYRQKENGIFVDQLPVNLAPLFFKRVKTLTDPGLNMAPWNLHERYITAESGGFTINKIHPLKFYHFSSFVPDKNELPLHHYNRFKLADRPDLKNLYADYNEELKAAGYFFYRQFKCVYALMRESHLREIKKATYIKRWLPVRLFNGKRKK